MLRRAIRKESGSDLCDAGDYRIFECDHAGVNFIEFICPHDGCGDKCHLPINGGPSHWQWNEATQTLSPSIKRMDDKLCMHHFSLINGEWVP